MKMKKYFNEAVLLTKQFIERYGEEVVRNYMNNVERTGNYRDYNIRISNDVVKYAAVGCGRMGEWANECGANDANVTALCVAVMKEVGLLK